MNDLLKDGKQNNTKLPYERYENILKDKAKYLEDVQEASLVNYDLWPGNVILKQDGNHFMIEGIIDFERAFWGDPMADFAGSIMLLDYIYEEKELWEVYCKEKKTVQAISKEAHIRFTLYRLYIYTIMAAEVFRYGYLYRKAQTSFAMKNIEKCLLSLEEA